MQQFFDFFGHGFCHQIRERSLEAGGVYFPMCARDTGIYLGLFVTVLIILLIYRQDQRKPSGLAPLPALITAAILALPMVIDGISSYAHLRETTNLIRFFSGYGAGIALGLLVSFAVMGMLRNSTDSLCVLATPRATTIAVLMSLLGAPLFWFIYPHIWIIAPLIALASFFGVIVFLNALILSMTKRFALPVIPDCSIAAAGFVALSRRRWCVVLGISAGFALVEISIMGMVREYIFNVIFNGSFQSLQELF
jgi:uncharacterized membrane protein